MRILSFVERLELDFSPNYLQKGQHPWSLCQQAIFLGDVDDDGCNELTVGTMSGHLLIYKGSELQPWKSSHDLGMVTCVCVGNVCNDGRNYILAMSADGWCSLFLLSNKATQDELMSAGMSDHDLRPIHRQHLHANSKVLMLADIDNDGCVELTVGYSDRIVRTYRWYTGNNSEGEFVALQKWTLQAQIGSLSMSRNSDNLHDIIVSQPAASYVTLKPNGEVEQYQSEADKARNETVFTEVVGNVGTNDVQHNYKALCTLDGDIMLLDNEGRTIWGIHVDHQLFGLTKLDITGDGVEEVIVCSWDGQTYIVNANKQIARFQFDEPTAAFIAGYYSVAPNRNEPCLIYVTFDGRIYIYHNIKLAQVQTISLIEVLSSSNDVKTFLNRVNMSDCTREEKRKLYCWCLYGRKPRLVSDQS